VLAVAPDDPGLVVAGSDVAGIFISHDGGDTFAPRGAGLSGLAVSGLAFDPGRPGTLAVQTDEGLYLSRDNGETLVRLGDLGYGERFFGSRLLVPMGDDLVVATRSKGLFRVSWRQAKPAVTPLPGLENRRITSLALFGDRLFAATNAGAFTLQNGRFTDASRGLSSGRSLTDMAATPQSGLFAVEERSGLWRYAPDKDAWVRPGPLPALPEGAKKPVRFKALALDPAVSGRLYMATHPDYWPYLLFASDDGGKAFTRIADFALSPGAPPNYAAGLEAVENMCVAPDGRTVFVADWWNLWRSRDGGRRFEQLHAGLQNTVVNALTPVPGQPRAMLAATADNGLMATPDAGKTWARIAQGIPDGHVADVRASPADPAKRYLLAEPWKRQDAPGTITLHLYRSTDGGGVWRPLPVTIPAKPLPGNHASGRPTLLVIDPADDDTLYLGTNGHGLYRVHVPSLMQGDAAAVTELSRSLPQGTFFGPQSLLVFPETPGLLVAATVGGGIWRSQDGGKSWRLASAPGLFAFCLAADPARPGRLLAGLPEKRLLESQDQGKTWKERVLPGDRPPHVAVQAIAFDPARPGLMAVGTAAYDQKAADGLYQSRDGGATFVRTPFPGAPVGVTALSPGPDGLWAGYNGLGVWRLEPQP
jgi:photosystem II stability/assembly factor-like uncharacterized protein